MMQLSAKTPPFPGYMGGDKEGGNEPYLPETDLTLKYGSYQPLGWFRIGTDMPRKPGNLNPDSTAGNARLGTGRGSNAGRSQPIPKGSLPTPKKFSPPAGIKVRPAGWVDYVDPTAKFPVHGKTSFTLNRGGRWQGNKVPDKPLSEYVKQVPLKVTNTRTGTSAIFGNSTKEDAVKRFLESETVYAKLTQGFGSLIKKEK